MTDVRVPPLPDEYEAMYLDTIKDLKEIVMKIRGTWYYESVSVTDCACMRVRAVVCGCVRVF